MCYDCMYALFIACSVFHVFLACNRVTGSHFNLAASSSSSFKGQAVDVWAAGVTLFCFVYGKVRYGNCADLEETCQFSHGALD